MSVHYDQGRYSARITGQTLAVNRSGNPELQLQITPYQFHRQDGPVQLGTDWPRTVYLALTEATLGTTDRPGWVLSTLSYLGFAGTSFAELDPENPDHHSFIGRDVEARCTHDAYEGKEREKWTISRPGGSAATGGRIDKKGLRALDARFGKLLKTLATKRHGQSATSPAPSSPPSAAAPKQPQKADSSYPDRNGPASATDDNIPF